MRRIEVGLVAAVVAVTMSLAPGTGSAAAATTKLCEANTSPCPAGQNYLSGSPFEVTGEASIGKFGCELFYKFTLAANSGAPLLAKVTSFELRHCSPGVTITPAGPVAWKYAFSVGTPSPGGTAVMSNTFLPIKLEVTPTGSTTCVYEFSSIPETIGPTGFISASSVTGTLGLGSGCASTVSLSFGATASPTLHVTE
jgi:hypothetical protein